MQPAIRDRIKAIAARTECGTLRGLSEQALTAFLQVRPYTDTEFDWTVAPSPNAPDKVDFNAVVSESLQKRVKREAIRMDVSLRTFVLTALAWFIFDQLGEPLA